MDARDTAARDCSFVWNDDHWFCTVCQSPFRYGRPGPRKPPRRNCGLAPARPRGPGDFLHDIIKSRLGQRAIAGCGCHSVWAEMNQLSVDGCRREIDRLAARLVEIATQREWLIQSEEGQDVAEQDIGKPVPQTWRTRTARGFARIAAKLPAGMTLIEWQCQRLVLLAIRRAEWDEWKRQVETSSTQHTGRPIRAT